MAAAVSGDCATCQHHKPCLSREAAEKMEPVNGWFCEPGHDMRWDGSPAMVQRYPQTECPHWKKQEDKL